MATAVSVPTKTRTAALKTTKTYNPHEAAVRPVARVNPTIEITSRRLRPMRSASLATGMLPRPTKRMTDVATANADAVTPSPTEIVLAPIDSSELS